MARSTPADSQPASSPDSGLIGAGSSKREWRDLVVVGVIALLGIVLSGAPKPFSIPFGLLSIILAPGYAFAAAALPADDDIDWISRLGLGLGLSFAVIAALAPMIDRIPGGLTFGNIRAVTAIATLAFLVLAGIRRGLGAKSATIITQSAPSLSRTPRAIRFTQAIVIVNLVIAGIGYATTIFDQPPAPTAFHALGPGGQIAEYPRRSVSGQSVEVQLAIEQSIAAAGTYRIVVRQDDTDVATREDLAIARGGVWSEPIRIPTDVVGQDLEFTIALLRPGDEQPYRILRLWMDVVRPDQAIDPRLASPSARP